MHIYAFGSICRGEVDASSDIDMLAIVNGHDARFRPTSKCTHTNFLQRLVCLVLYNLRSHLSHLTLALSILFEPFAHFLFGFGFRIDMPLKNRSLL